MQVWAPEAAARGGASRKVSTLRVYADVWLDAPIKEEVRQRPVQDGRADLCLDVIPDDGESGIRELLGPRVVGGDEHRDAEHEAAP